MTGHTSKRQLLEEGFSAVTSGWGETLALPERRKPSSWGSCTRLSPDAALGDGIRCKQSSTRRGLLVTWEDQALPDRIGCLANVFRRFSETRQHKPANTVIYSNGCSNKCCFKPSVSLAASALRALLLVSLAQGGTNATLGLIDLLPLQAQG